MSPYKPENEHLDIDWYRVPIDKATLAELNRRSDLKATLQLTGHLGLLALTGGAAIYGIGRWPWYAIVALVFIHSTFFHFLLNGFHELCHGNVFRTKALNDAALKLVSALSLHHYVAFQESHKRHHRYTLHPPFDSEVVPFYNLPKLNRLIRDHLPEPPRGVLATWRHIAAIQRRQREDPHYVYVPELPKAT